MYNLVNYHNNIIVLVQIKPSSLLSLTAVAAVVVVGTAIIGGTSNPAHFAVAATSSSCNIRPLGWKRSSTK